MRTHSPKVVAQPQTSKTHISSVAHILIQNEVVIAESVNNEVVKESEDRPSGSLFGLGKVVDKLDDLVHRLRSVEQTHLMELEFQGGFLVEVCFIFHDGSYKNSTPSSRG